MSLMRSPLTVTDMLIWTIEYGWSGVVLERDA